VGADGHFFMSNVRGKIYCQRCEAPNEMGEDLCGRCGTRLMLLVEPSAARFEGRGVAAGHGAQRPRLGRWDRGSEVGS